MAPVMVVTGSSRGIGAATVRLAAERGYDVCVTYRSQEDQAQALGSDLRGTGARVAVVHADTSNEEDVVRLFDEVDHRLGPVAVLVNNAGVIGRVCRVSDVTRADLDQVFGPNVFGYFLSCREAIRRMSPATGGHGGVIVNVSSRASEIGAAGEFVHYAASKGAIDSMTVGLARETGPLGIRVNAVSPGLIDTDMQYPGRLDRLTPSVPLGRAGTAREVAEAILWLASEEASYVNGAILPIGGGR